MKLWYFNVQLIPIDGGDGRVGKNGYKKLFKKASQLASAYWGDQRLHELAFEYRKNYHAFKPFKVQEEYASGNLLKFDLVEKIIQPYTDEKLFDARNKPASSDPNEFYFFFSFEKHVFALESKRRVPSPNVVKNILRHLLGEVANELFPEYSLHVSLLNDYGLVQELEKKASGYYSAQIEASFTNSWDFVDDEVKQLEEELREKGINKVSHTEKAATGGIMSSLSKFAMKFLIVSIPSGHATVQYLNSETGQRDKFNTDEKPVVMELDDKLEDKKTQVEPEELDRRVQSSVILAMQRSVESRSNMDENHRVGSEYLDEKIDND